MITTDNGKVNTCINIYIKRAYIFRLETAVLVAAGGDLNIRGEEGLGMGKGIGTVLWGVLCARERAWG